MHGTALKRRASRFASVRVLNPVMRRALEAGLVPRGWALLETTGRTSGEPRPAPGGGAPRDRPGRRGGAPRRVPVGDGLRGPHFWIVAEHGRHAHYVRNIERDPRGRVTGRLRWRPGCWQL